MCCSIFMDDFYFFREPFDFYYFYIIYFVFILYYIISTGSINLLPGWFFKFLLVLFGLSLLAGLFYNTLTFSFTKQVIGITFSSTAFYCLLKVNKFDLEKIFKIYLVIKSMDQPTSESMMSLPSADDIKNDLYVRLL